MKKFIKELNDSLFGTTAKWFTTLTSFVVISMFDVWIASFVATVVIYFYGSIIEVNMSIKHANTVMAVSFFIAVCVLVYNL